MPPGYRLISKPTQNFPRVLRNCQACYELKLAGSRLSYWKSWWLGCTRHPPGFVWSIPLYSLAWHSEPPLQAFIFCYRGTW